MKKIRVAIVGYGNIGKYALEALEAAPDMEVAGVVRRNGNVDCPAERSSDAPTLVNTASTTPTVHSDAGTKEPI